MHTFFFQVSLPELPYKVETASGELIMDWVHPRDADEIREYLLRNFFTVTPIREVYCMEENNEAARQSTWFMNQLRDLASQPYSVVVHNKTNNGDRQIVATSLHKVELKPNLSSDKPPMRNVSDEPFDQSFGWLRRAIQKEFYRDLDLFDHYQTDKIFKSCLSSSRADLRQLGLLSTMLNVAMKRAYRDGVRVYQSEIFHTHAQRVGIKFGCEILRTINVADFECPAGVKPFANAKELLREHPYFILFGKQITQ